MKLVNGYPCTSGCEERLARRGIDPRNPRQDPVKQAELDARDPAKAAKIEAEKRAEAERAVVFGGRLAGTADSPAPRPVRLLDRLV